MARLLRLATGLLLLIVFAASCGLPATQGGASRTQTSVAPATTVPAQMTSAQEATVVPSVTLTSPAPTTEPTGTFAAGGMIIPTKTLHPEGYTFEDSDIRSDLRTLRPELNELQAPFATALRGTAVALGRFPSATPWPFPVTPNPTPILDSWIVGDPATQASALKVYTDLLTFVASSGQLSVEEFSEGLKAYMIYDAEVNPGGYCKYRDLVATFRALKSQGRFIRFSVPRVQLVETDPGFATMLLYRDAGGFYYSFMIAHALDSVAVEVVDSVTQEVVEIKQYRDGLVNWYFFPRLEEVDGDLVWRLYSGEVPIGCYR